MRVAHPIPPAFDTCSEVLLLGSFPSPKSREQGFYYGHPHNRMWKVLAALFDEPVPNTVERRRDFLARHHIAMWDVLASCEITGASDASITGEVPNDLAPVLDGAPIKAIFCTGKTAARLFAKHLEPATGRSCTTLPSTSPANAAWKLDALVEAYRALLDHLGNDVPPTLGVPEVVALEQAIAAAGTPLAELMDRAGRWLAYRAHVRQPGARVVVLAGNGNNGGDGWVAARELAEEGHQVALVSARDAHDLEAQPARDAALKALAAFRKLGVELFVSPAPAELETLLCGADIIIDAMLGTGFAHDTVRAPFDTWIEAANRARTQGAYVLAADCPSGLNAQTGTAARPHIRADETLTMITRKPGLQTRAGKAACGTTRVATLCNLAPFC